MRKLCKLLIPFSLMLTSMTGCVVAPVGYYHRGYYGPRVAVVAPAPVVVVRPELGLAGRLVVDDGVGPVNDWLQARRHHGKGLGIIDPTRFMVLRHA